MFFGLLHLDLVVMFKVHYSYQFDKPRVRLGDGEESLKWQTSSSVRGRPRSRQWFDVSQPKISPQARSWTNMYALCRSQLYPLYKLFICIVLRNIKSSWITNFTKHQKTLKLD